MIVYALLLYTCVSVQGSVPNTFMKSCTWQATSNFFAKEATCQATGRATIGTAINGDQAAGARVEDFRCNGSPVNEE